LSDRSIDLPPKPASDRFEISAVHATLSPASTATGRCDTVKISSTIQAGVRAAGVDPAAPSQERTVAHTFELGKRQGHDEPLKLMKLFFSISLRTSLFIHRFRYLRDGFYFQ
jgi:hypothetical protein